MNRGFSLIEVLVVIAILAVAAGALTPVIRLGIDSWVFARDQKEILAEATLAMNRMVAEIRQAESLINDCGWILRNWSCGFTKFGSTDTIQFGKISSIEFARRFNCEWPGAILCSNLKFGHVDIFTYFDENGDEMPYPEPKDNPDLVRSIRIKLILQKVGCSDCKEYTFQTTVRPLGLQ